MKEQNSGPTHEPRQVQGINARILRGNLYPAASLRFARRNGSSPVLQFPAGLRTVRLTHWSLEAE